jgi:hypothetical protein
LDGQRITGYPEVDDGDSVSGVADTRGREVPTRRGVARLIRIA